MHYMQEEEWLGDHRVGDFEQGQGISSAGLANPNITLPALHPGLASGPAFTQSPGIWVLVVAFLVIVKIVSEKAGEAGEFATVKIGLENFLIIGLISSLFIYSAKFASASASWVPGPVKQFFGVV